MTDLFAPTIKEPPLELRDYQDDAVRACYDRLSAGPGHTLIEIPTGGGKTPVIAQLCADVTAKWGGSVLVLAHVKELLQQAADKLARVGGGLDVGVYSAGLGRKELGRAVTVAGIQSVYQKADRLPAVDLVLIDEAHRIPHAGMGIYHQALEAVLETNPLARVVGLTATPFRTKGGDLTGGDSIFSDVCYSIGVADLIDRGFLSKMVTKRTGVTVDTGRLRVNAGEFVTASMAAAMMDDELFGASMSEIIERTAERKSVLLFCAGVEHCRAVVARLARDGIDCGMITGDTDPTKRASLISAFTNGRLKYLANVDVLTTGFDAPGIDTVVLLRSTMSPGLYYQMVGRGFRVARGKTDCLVLDYGGNIELHGPVDRLNERIRAGGRPRTVTDAPLAYFCPECDSAIASGEHVCPECGHDMTPDPIERNGSSLGGNASDAEVVWGKDYVPERTRETFEVSSVQYERWESRRNPDGPPTMRVTYWYGIGQRISEWICLEHVGYAGRKAELWWRERSIEGTVPVCVDDAVHFAQGGELAEPKTITIETTEGEKWPAIVGYELGPKPGSTPAPLDITSHIPDDDIPF